jgi:Magnesium chelatase, subunit ChlI
VQRLDRRRSGWGARITRMSFAEPLDTRPVRGGAVVMAPAPPALTALVAKEKARQAFWPYCAVRRSSGHWGRISATGRRLPTILPAMTLAEAIETTRIHRVAGLTGDRTALVTTRPFRAPHHTISDAGLIGGGHVPMPGEVSLAHHGVLFLDEWPEVRRHVLEVSRQPLDNRITQIQSPARPRPGCVGRNRSARQSCIVWQKATRPEQTDSSASP